MINLIELDLQSFWIFFSLFICLASVIHLVALLFRYNYKNSVDVLSKTHKLGFRFFKTVDLYFQLDSELRIEIMMGKKIDVFSGHYAGLRIFKNSILKSIYPDIASKLNMAILKASGENDRAVIINDKINNKKYLMHIRRLNKYKYIGYITELKKQ